MLTATKEARETAVAPKAPPGTKPTTALASRTEAEPWLFARAPFVFMRKFAEDMEHMFEDFDLGQKFITPGFERGILPRFLPTEEVLWTPTVEVLEKNGKLIVRAELPGLKKEAVKIEVIDNVLTLKGERKEEKEEKKEGFYRSERSYGSFYRTIPLPEGVNTEKATATFNNGLLEISMDVPVKKTMGRTIEIK